MFFKRLFQSDPLSDAELIQRYQQTADVAFAGELFQRYTHLVFGVCMKYLKNEEDSKDATMQIFEKLVVELQKHEVANFGSWLHVLAKNYCLMQLRSARTRWEKNIQLTDWPEDMENNGFVHLEEDREADLLALEKSMNGLPAEQKQCVELFYLQQKSYKEIAEVTGFDLKKVKSYIQNGKRNLKIYMTRENE
jgi:RNA polymerase sigma factor (sigma-70 family)